MVSNGKGSGSVQVAVQSHGTEQLSNAASVPPVGPAPLPAAAPKKQRWKRCFKAWDVKANTVSLWKRSPKAIPILDGLRLFACLWVVAFHSIDVAGVSAPTVQRSSAVIAGETLKFERSWWLQPLQSGDMGVDVFFVLSGFLIAYILWSEFDRTSRIRYGTFLLRRWLRLMPVYCIAMLYVFVMPYDGPVVREECRSTWWMNLLLLNNFLGKGVLHGCFGHGWSVAMEYQFYIVSPLIVVLARHERLHRRRRGWVLLVALSLLSVAIRAILLSTNDWEDYDLSLVYDKVGAPNHVC